MWRTRYKIQYDCCFSGSWYWFVYSRRWWFPFWMFDHLFSVKADALTYVDRKIKPKVEYF